MNTIDDLKNLSTQQRRIILRAAHRHLKKLPTAHTIILTKKPGLKTAQVLTDFELIIYVNEYDDMRQMCDKVSGDEVSGDEVSGDEVSGDNVRQMCGDDMRQICGDDLNDDPSDDLSDESDSESSGYNPYAATEKTYPICYPRLDYKRSARLVEPEESVALSYTFENIYKKTHDSYLEFLERHLMFFVKNDFMSVTTVNTTAMEKDCPLYSQLYMIYHFETDYVIYNRDVRPKITINHQI